jgi:hypothetical protein
VVQVDEEQRTTNLNRGVPGAGGGAVVQVDEDQRTTNLYRGVPGAGGAVVQINLLIYTCRSRSSEQPTCMEVCLEPEEELWWYR